MYVVLIVLACTGFFFAYFLATKLAKPTVVIPTQVTQQVDTGITQAYPKKTEYQNILPPNFPQEIILEKDVKLSQSYLKEYPDRMNQKSVVLFSEKQASFNYNTYKDFINNNGWIMSNTGKQDTMSFLQAVKNNQRLEVMIIDKSKTKVATGTVFSHVVINLFEK